MTTRSARVPWLIALLASACAAPLDESDEALEGEEATGETSDALRIGGEALETPTTPWTRRPTLFSQVNLAATAATFNARQEEIEGIDPDYYPSLLASAETPGSSPVYVGTWHKDRKVTNWVWDKNIAMNDFQARWQELKDEGFEFFDFNVHLDVGSPRFDGVWLKREGQKPSKWYMNANLAQLQTRIVELKIDGYRPKRISEYKFNHQALYNALWVKDGLTDFRWNVNKAAVEIDDLNERNEADGYVMTDISVNNLDGTVRYSAIWLKSSEVRASHFDADMTELEFREKNQAYQQLNRVLVDFNVYYDRFGALKYAAVWHRTEKRDALQSNVTFSDSDTKDLTAAIDSYRNNTTDVGDGGRFGLFVQNLQSGSWIGFNMNEPFYMASTIKLLLAAKVIDDEDPTWDPTTLRRTDWRGEEDRGFVKADFNNTNFPLDTFLANMLDNSDTASTDRLWGLVETATPDGMRRYLRSNLGLQNVGEVTSICEVDKRVQLFNDACVKQVSCDTFEAWLRDGDSNYNASSSERNCLQGLDISPEDQEYDPYYATYANSISPVEYGHALNELMGSEMSNAERARFLKVLDEAGDNDFDEDEGTQWQQMGTKGGDKHKVTAQVGMMWDWNSTPRSHANVTPRYTFAVFAERYKDEDFKARPDMREAVKHAVRFLQNK